MPSLPIFPHLGMTEEAFDAICQELFDADPVLAGHKTREVEYLQKSRDYEQRITALKEEVNRFDLEAAELEGRLKAITRQKRETLGQVASYTHHIKIAGSRAREAVVSHARRQKQLYMSEARRRLGRLGKELKLGVGGYRAGRGRGTEIIDKEPKHETQTTPQ